MPFPNEHSATLLDSAGFSKFRRASDKPVDDVELPSGVFAIWGNDGTNEGALAIRFDKSKWSPAKAKDWLLSNSIAIEAFETATELDSCSSILQWSGSGKALLLGESGSVRRYRKDLIRDGDFVHPTDKLKFKITPQLREHWADTFDRMKANGVRVPLPAGHSTNADNNRGWITEMFNEGDRLVGVCEVSGDAKEADRLVASNDVSIFVPQAFEDGAGNRYQRPIVHVALTPHPVITGLGEFVPLAASIYSNQEKEPKMNWDKLKTGLGITEDVTDDNAVDLVLAHVVSLNETHETALKPLNERIVALEKATPKKRDVDDLLLKLAHENRAGKLDQLVVAARITPAVRDKLVAAFIGDKSTALRLSLEQGTPDKFDELVLALSENDPVKLKEQTAAQTLKLSQDIDDPSKSSIVADAEKRAAAEKK